MTILVLSDLHLGNGGPYDIFAGESELPELLATLVGEKVHVVLNGDTFDFLMNDDPLVLRTEQADRQAEALVSYPGTRAVLQKLGELVRKGGQVTFRSGNHDLEIGLPSVQHVIAEAMGGLHDRVTFSVDEGPLVFETRAGTVLVAHGEGDDAWNRFTHGDVQPGNGAFSYPPGSRLVKAILNPVKNKHGLRFADLLKPDFSGAALAALAVKPWVVSELGKRSAGKLVYQLIKRKTADPDALAGGPVADDPVDIESPLGSADLTGEERTALEALTDDVDQPDGFIGEAALESALQKAGVAGLRGYAAAHRWIAGEDGEGYFSLKPDEAEWNAAKELAEKHGAKFVVAGHTHAARWGMEAGADGIGYLNSGTWISLMRLPSHVAGTAEWARFLDLLRRDPGLVGEAKGLVQKRLTGVRIDALDGPELVAWGPAGLVRAKAWRVGDQG